MRGHLVDHGVDRLAGLDHAHQHARALQRADPIGDRLMAAQRPLGAVLLHELLGSGGSPVVDRDRNVVVGDVAREVGAHRGEAGEAEVGLGAHRTNLPCAARAAVDTVFGAGDSDGTT